MFFSPNQAAVMNSLPADQRGAGAGMLNTFQNSASVLSIGVFFTIITLGLAASLPSHLYSGLIAQGVPAGPARTVSHLPPIGSLFAAFLGYNPIQQLLGNQHTLQATYHLSAAHAQYLLGRSFFPKLISNPSPTGSTWPSISPPAPRSSRPSPPCCGVDGTCTPTPPWRR